MKNIITTNIKNLTLDSGFVRIESSKGEVIVDIKKMIKEPIGSEIAYFNATRVAEFFGRKKELNTFMRLKSTKEYIEILEEEFCMITRNSRNHTKPVKTHFVKRGKETNENKGTFGTYLHNELFFEYLSWCDVRFRREIHKIMKLIILQSNEIKIERANTKALFHPLTDTIRDIYVPAQESENAKKFAYSSLMTLINLQVLGCSAKKYAINNDIEVNIKGGKSIRDYLPQEMLTIIKRLEEDLNGYIKYAKVTDYHDLKSKIEAD